MKKQTRNLVIIIIFLFLLMGGFLLFINKKDVKEPEVSEISKEEDKSVNLFDFNIDDLKSVKIKNELDEYEIVKNQDKYEIEELKGLPLIDEYFSFLDNVYTLDASSKIENPEDLKEYGLKNPNIIIVIINGNEEITINVGNLVPDESAYYVTLNDDKDVYIVDKSFVADFLKDKLHYIKKELVDGILAISSADIKSLVIGGTSQNGKDMVFEPVVHDADDIYSAYRAGHVLIKPIKHDVKIDKMSALLESIFTLNAKEIEKLNPTSEDLEKYGLNNPLVTVKGSYIEILEEPVEGEEEKTPAEGDIDFIIGDLTEDGQYYYAMKTGVPIVYKVEKASIFYADEKYTDFMNAMLLIPYIYDVKTIDIEFLDNTTADIGKFNIEHFVSKEETKAEGEPTKQVFDKVLVNEKEVDADVYKKIYQILISIRGETAATDEIIQKYQDIEPIFKVKYNYFDDAKKSDEVKLIKVDERTVLVVVNNESHFTMRNVYIKKLYDSIILLQEGKDVESTEW